MHLSLFQSSVEALRSRDSARFQHHRLEHEARRYDLPLTGCQYFVQLDSQQHSNRFYSENVRGRISWLFLFRHLSTERSAIQRHSIVSLSSFHSIRESAISTWTEFEFPTLQTGIVPRTHPTFQHSKERRIRKEMSRVGLKIEEQR